MTKCKICNCDSKRIFIAKVLFKYEVDYFQCEKCQFIQTEKAYWLDEAYATTITELDLGYLTRNILFSEVTSKVVKHAFSRNASFLDYGGGYGIFVRLMRDKGFDFYREDKYCDNLFSAYFDLSDLGGNNMFELLTAFEVFEHLENPIVEIEKMMEFADSILFSTELQPKINFTNSNDWWYFAPETGQHLSFFTRKSLLEIADKFGLNLFSSKSNLHLMTKKKFRFNPLTYPASSSRLLDKILRRNFSNPKSLLHKDYQMVKHALTSQNAF